MTDQPLYTGPSLLMQSTGQIYPLTPAGVISIGRKAANTIVLPPNDLKASRHHATISWQEGRYILQDAGSVNGTFLNNKPVSGPTPLRSGDVIGVGSETLLVYLPEADTEPRLAPPNRRRLSPRASPPLTRWLRWGGQPGRSAGISENPYVGRAPFCVTEANRFFCREVEARELLSLVNSERGCVLPQSGAGKSSAAECPAGAAIAGRGLAVLPVGRVSGQIPQGVTEVEIIFVFNLLLSMMKATATPAASPTCAWLPFSKG
jgi:hypothetical protein